MNRREHPCSLAKQQKGGETCTDPSCDICPRTPSEVRDLQLKELEQCLEWILEDGDPSSVEDELIAIFKEAEEAEKREPPGLRGYTDPVSGKKHVFKKCTCCGVNVSFPVDSRVNVCRVCFSGK